MHIDRFEGEIEEKILIRGEVYFITGSVEALWREPSGYYGALVDGTKPYDVRIIVDEHGIVGDHFCDCPYTWGEFCKHEVAVMFAIREARACQKVLPSMVEGAKDGLRDILNACEKEELVELLCFISRKYNLHRQIKLYLENDA